MSTLSDSELPLPHDEEHQEQPETVPPRHYHPRRFVLIVAMLVIVGATALVASVLVVHKNKESTRQEHQDDNDLPLQQEQVESLLPFLQVDITQESNDMVQGTITVLPTNREIFTFASSQEQDQALISFQCDKAKAAKTDEMDGWCGMTYVAHKDQDVKIVLSRYVEGTPDEIIILTKDTEEELPPEQVAILESFVSSKMAEYFVGLTFKLATLHKTGLTNVAYKQLHAQARWLYSIALKDPHVDLQWDLGGGTTQEGGRRRGLHETDIVASLNRALMMNTNDKVTSSNEMTYVDWYPERNLGWEDYCPGPNPYSKCGNPKFGMCGPDSTCWQWYCGTCQCQHECHEHDYYCSCRSMFHFWCLNVFWISCGPNW